MLFLVSLTINIVYLYFSIEQKKHQNEFRSLFEIKDISYGDGLSSLHKRLKNVGNQKSYHLIHIWDTFLTDPNKEIPYLSQLDGFFKYNPSKPVDCILMSAMCDKSIAGFLDPRNIKFRNAIQLNDMDDYISGVCNKKNYKTKKRAVNLLINKQGDILYYNDKIKGPLDQDTLLLQTLNSLN